MSSATTCPLGGPALLQQIIKMREAAPSASEGLAAALMHCKQKQVLIKGDKRINSQPYTKGDTHDILLLGRELEAP